MSVRGLRPGAATTSIALPSVSRGSVYEPSLQELRPDATGSRKLLSVALTALRHSESLLPINPGAACETVRPASFSQIKPLQKTQIRFPESNLQPAKLIAADAVSQQPAKADVKPSPAPKAFRAAAGAAIPAPPMDAPSFERKRGSFKATTSEPLWHALFAPESDLRGEKKRKASTSGNLAPAPHPHSAFDWATAGDIEVEDLTTSRTRREKAAKPAPVKRYWVWQTVEGVFLSKTFARSLAAVTILLFASTVDVPWKDWLNRQATNIKQPIASAIDQLSKPIQERAAFQITDEFTSGIENWKSSQRLNVDPAGWLKMQQGLALNGATIELTDYRLDFDAKIQSRAVGWVVRAPDTQNFYEFKLFQKGSASNPTYSLSRYSMLDGVKTLVAENIEVPSHLAKPDDFNRISMRVVGQNVTTLINGWGVDHWRDGAIERGGVGLIADAGESALVRKMTVSGNDDTWGLILYGAIESVRSVQEFFGQSPSPAMVLFHRPGGMMMANASPTFLIQGPQARP